MGPVFPPYLAIGSLELTKRWEGTETIALVLLTNLTFLVLPESTFDVLLLSVLKMCI